ncbi:MAG: hypothetical protein R3E89_16625 [Thiolinea sp.]
MNEARRLMENFGEMFMHKLPAACRAGLMLLSGFMASAVSAEALDIDFIDVKYFSHIDGKITEYRHPANDYGLDMDLLIQVGIKGQAAYTENSSRVMLDVQADGWSDRATGEHQPWKLNQSIAFHALPETGLRRFLFVVPYEDCYPDVKLTASFTHHGESGRKSRTISLACAE